MLFLCNIILNNKALFYDKNFVDTLVLWFCGSNECSHDYPCTLDGCVRSNIDLKLALALRSQKFVQFFNSYFIFFKVLISEPVPEEHVK